MTVILYKYTDNINIKLAIISKTMCFIINRSEVKRYSNLAVTRNSINRSSTLI